MDNFIDTVESVQHEIKEKTFKLLMFIFMFFEIFLNTTRKVFCDEKLTFDEEKQLFIKKKDY